MHREGRVQAGQATDKMVFPYSDGAFGGVLAVIVGGNQLEVHVGLAHELFQGGRAFVV